MVSPPSVPPGSSPLPFPYKSTPFCFSFENKWASKG